ncbi:MAG: pitrilysin family protein [Myxococcota bacterium]|nr:pitrilysin family protein [Myxococcota bacterium]
MANGFHFTRHRLANGMVILLQPDPHAPVVSYQTWCRAGSAMDPAKRSGMAHLFEHLMFTGTDTVPEGELDRRIEAFGGRINAATWLDWTYHYVDAPRAALADVINLEADRFQNINLEAERLNAEREVVLNERREMVDDEADGQLSETLWSTAYADHVYGQPTIGWAADIEAISIDDCRSFYERWYAADQIILVVTGGFDVDETLAHIQAAYGTMTPSGVQGPALAETEVRHGATEELVLPTAAERVLIGFHTPAGTHIDHVALAMVNEIILEGESSRLFRRIVSESELAVSAYGYVPPLRGPGLYEMGFDLRPGLSAELVMEETRSVVEDFVRHGPTDAELLKAKNRIQTRFFSELQTAQRRAQALGYWEVIHQAEYLMTRSDQYRSMTKETMLAAARKYLDMTQCVTVIGRTGGA